MYEKASFIFTLIVLFLHAIAMATPIAHKGSLTGAQATALTLIDLFTNPKVLADAKSYFKNAQTKDVQ